MHKVILAAAAMLLTSTPAFADTNSSDQSFSVFSALLHRPVIFVKSIATGAQHGAAVGMSAIGVDETTNLKDASLPMLGAAALGATAGAAAGALVEPVVNTFKGKEPDQQ